MSRDIEQWRVSKPAISSAGGMVAAQHVTAAKAGAAMLDAGGNAIDAAIATAFALGVVEPWMSGLGGSGYMVIWCADEGRGYSLDFQGVLPRNIDQAAYPLDPTAPATIMGFPGVIGGRNVHGYGSILVPGAAAGLCHGLERFGTLGLDRVLAPAIALAKRGLAVDWFTTLQIALAMPELRRDEAASRLYLPDGTPPAPERTLPLDRLARTLETLATEGAASFYRGEIAASILADLRAGGSPIEADDLAGYQVLESEPLFGRHRGADLLTAGPTSGGPRLLSMLRHVETMLDRRHGLQPESFTVYARALDLAWRAHKKAIGRATEVGGCTSHLSTVDNKGNMVALTFTLLNRFGSGVLLPGSGLLMNNAVSYFDPRSGLPTSMAGNKRINASNMCPTIVLKDGEARFAIGASGANHIMPATAMIAALMLDFDLSLEEAFNGPRIDASDRGSLRVDPALGSPVLAELGRHFELEIADRLVFPKLYACPSGVARDPATGICQGINDPSLPIGGAAAPAPFTIQPAPSTDVPVHA